MNLYSQHKGFLLGILLASFFCAFSLSSILGSVYIKHIIYLFVFAWLGFSLCLTTPRDKYSIEKALKLYIHTFIVLMSFYALFSFYFEKVSTEIFIVNIVSLVLTNLVLLYSSKLKKMSLVTFEIFAYLFITIYCFFIIKDFSIAYTELGNYLTATLPIGACLVMSFIRSFDDELPLYLKAAAFILSLFFLFSLTQFMGRGSFVLSLFVTLIFLMSNFNSIKRLVYGVFIIFLVVIFYNVFASQFTDSTLYKRLETLANGDVGERAYTYGQLLYSLDFTTVLTGFGFGRTGFEVYGEKNYYPHNIHFHYLTELGLIGFCFSLFFIWLCFFGFIKLFKRKLDISSKLFFFMFLYVYFNFLKSFSMYDSWWLSLSAGLFLSSYLSSRGSDELV